MTITKQNAPTEAGAFRIRLLSRSAAVAEYAQQHEEQVDEVEVEPQRAHDRLAAGDRAVIVHVVHFLDRLRVPGGEPGEHEDADGGNHEGKPGAGEEHV